MRVKRYLLVLVAFVLVFSSLSFAQKDPNTLTFSDLEFKPLKPGLMSVKKGIDFYYKENHELPSISMFIVFRGGLLGDPAGKEGLASLAMRLMKSGGTANLTPEKVEEKLDFLGSSIGCSASGEFSQINLWTLTKNFSETWKILTDILYNPAFDKERFETEKKKDLEMIRRRWDRPASVGNLSFGDLLYGKGYPDIRRTTVASVGAITIDDLRAYYEKNIKDAAIVVAFAGDFKTAEVSALLKDTFKDWKGKPAGKFDLPKAALASKPGVYFIEKEDMTQAIVLLGHLGINRLDPDNVEIGIMNFILGSGGFNSRIMREVRSNRGLAYAAYGYVGGGRDLGQFTCFSQTKNQSVGEAIKLMKDIIADMTVNPVSAAELDTAKKYEQNSFVHRFDSARTVLTEAIFNKLLGYPEDYIETYIPKIKKVDAAKVLSMAKRTMHPDNLIVLVVGKKAEIIDQLKALDLGEVKELPLPKE
jgi:zinc protease